MPWLRRARTHVTLEDLIRGVWPLVILELFILAVLIAFPVISLWLPPRLLGA